VQHCIHWICSVAIPPANKRFSLSNKSPFIGNRVAFRPSPGNRHRIPNREVVRRSASFDQHHLLNSGYWAAQFLDGSVQLSYCRFTGCGGKLFKGFLGSDDFVSNKLNSELQASPVFPGLKLRSPEFWFCGRSVSADHANGLSPPIDHYERNVLF